MLRIAEIIDTILQKNGATIKDVSGKNGLTFNIDNTWIAKMPTDEKTSELLKKEIRISQHLEQFHLPVAVPRWTEYKLSTGLTHFNFCAVCPIISGKHPAHLSHPALLADIGNFLAVLHEIEFPKDSIIPNQVELWFNTFISQQTVTPSLKEQLLQSVAQPLFAEYRQLIKPSLQHNDFHPGNILVDNNNRLCGVLDFGTAVLSAQLSDFYNINMYSDCGSIAFQQYRSKRSVATCLTQAKKEQEILSALRTQCTEFLAQHTRA